VVQDKSLGALVVQDKSLGALVVQDESLGALVVQYSIRYKNIKRSGVEPV
jgi:hypothetical protein